MSRHTTTLVAALSIAVALVGFGFLLVYHFNHHRTDDSGPAAGQGHEPGSLTASHQHRHPHHRHHPKHHPSGADAGPPAPAWFVGIPLGGGSLHPGVDVVPGALHHAVLTVTSSTGSPIGLKYAFRTASGFRSGHSTTGRGWSAAATVRGTEPLEGMVAQVASGSLTCTASIDGQVVDRKTNSGQFATVSCFG